MFIAIHAGGIPFNGNTIPSGKDLGGSESAAYYMAKELVSLGHEVTVYTSSQEEGSFEGVSYECHGNPNEQFPMGEKFHQVMQAPHDVVICQRHPMAFHRLYNSKLNIWWLHDLATLRLNNMVQRSLVNIDKVLTVSDFHKNQVHKTFDIPLDYITATTNGVDYSSFPKAVDRESREPNSLVFCSRPERGLEPLVQEGGIMEKLKDCHLHVCGYKNTTPQMENYYNYLFQRCEVLPNVTHHGALGKVELYKLIANKMLYVYPTMFEDTSNILSIEANACGTPFLGIRNSALPETIGDDGSVLLPKMTDGIKVKSFVKSIKQILKDRNKWEALNKKALNKVQDWKTAAKQWEALFVEELAKKSEGYRLTPHFESMSDIVVFNKDKSLSRPENFDKNYAFMINNQFKKHYKDYYQYEKDRGINYGEESLSGNRRFEVIFEMINEKKPKSILDYGCAHGHYVMNLGNRLPEIKYTGYDIEKTNIDKAVDWAAKYKFPAKFKQGEHTDVKGKYDIVMAGEVLEHVLNPQEICNSLHEHLNPNGYMLISVPYGPWEAIGYEEHKGWRAHIHHFERQDIIDIWGKQDKFAIKVIPHSYNMGHYVITYKPSEPLGVIDYKRKVKTQSPSETVSVCMIARNEENSIGKTLESVSSFSNEIIVGIDSNTTDRTEEICKKYGAITFLMDSPIDTGFAEARNSTIEKATMDWILWIDSDETLELIGEIKPLLRNNCFSGYAIQQHHYAAQPAALFKTDLPCRLFRNHRGVEFDGIVHEHPINPENKMGGVGKVMLVGDIAIMHTGYSTETVRKGRFFRNWELMKREYKENPERMLTKFLWTRDLVQYVRYTLQINGNNLTPDLVDMAKESIKIWRELLKLKDYMLVIEGLPFYSEAVKYVNGNNALEFAFNIEAKISDGQPLQFKDQPRSGLFETSEDISNLLSFIVDERTSQYKEKYY